MLSGDDFFLPVAALVALTFVVWCRMFVVRIGQMKRERIHPQSVDTSAKAAARLTDSRAADNFRNLLELPILFYLWVLFAGGYGSPSCVLLALCWLFVVLRVVHSVIHCSYNRVMHRFYAHMASAIVLWILWALLAALHYL